MPAKEGLGARGRAAEPRQGMRGGFWRAFLKREAGVCARRSVDELWTGNALRIVSRLWKCTGMRDFERAEEKSDVREFSLIFPSTLAGPVHPVSVESMAGGHSLSVPHSSEKLRGCPSEHSASRIWDPPALGTGSPWVLK